MRTPRRTPNAWPLLGFAGRQVALLRRASLDGFLTLGRMAHRSLETAWWADCVQRGLPFVMLRRSRQTASLTVAADPTGFRMTPRTVAMITRIAEPLATNRTGWGIVTFIALPDVVWVTTRWTDARMVAQCCVAVVSRAGALEPYPEPWSVSHV